MAIGASPELAAVPPATKTAKPSLLQRILERIPSSPAFKERKEKFTDDYETKQLVKLRGIFPESPGDGPSLRLGNIRLNSVFIAKRAELKFWAEEWDSWIAPIMIVGWLVVAVSAGEVLERRPPIQQFGASSGWVLLGVIAWVVVWVLLLYLENLLFQPFLEDSLSNTAQNIGMLFAPLAVVGLVDFMVVHYLRLAYPRSPLTFGLSVGLLVMAVLVASFLVWLVAVRLWAVMIERQVWEAHPLPSLFGTLLDMFPFVNWSFQHPVGMDLILRDLERAAYLMEGPLTRKLQAGDPTIQTWFDEQMKRRAAAIRELKKLVLYSGGAVPERFENKLKETLLHVCNLDWSRLEEMPVPVVSKRERARQFGQRLVKAATVSIIPAAILIARLSVTTVQQFDKTNAVLIGTIAWLCINLLSAFDPEYGLTKQGLDLLSKVPGVGSGRGRESSPGGEH